MKVACAARDSGGRWSVAKRFPLRLKIVTGVRKDNNAGWTRRCPFAVIEDVHPTDIQAADGIECGLTWDEPGTSVQPAHALLPARPPETVRARPRRARRRRARRDASRSYGIPYVTRHSVGQLVVPLSQEPSIPLTDNNLRRSVRAINDRN